MGESREPRGSIGKRWGWSSGFYPDGVIADSWGIEHALGRAVAEGPEPFVSLEPPSMFLGDYATKAGAQVVVPEASIGVCSSQASTPVHPAPRRPPPPLGAASRVFLLSLV